MTCLLQHQCRNPKHIVIVCFNTIQYVLELMSVTNNQFCIYLSALPTNNGDRDNRESE